MLNWWSIGINYQHQPALGWSLLTFLIFAALIYKFAQKPLQDHLQTRSDQIRTGIEDAKQAKEAAETKLAAFQKRLFSLEHEIAEIKSDFHHQGEEEKKRLQKEAEHMATELRKESSQLLQAETLNAIKKLKEELADHILLLAQKNFQATPEMDTKLCNSLIRDLQNETRI